MNFKHGGRRTSEYGIWLGIKSRCLLKTNKAYGNYGGRGISICDRWMDFASFLEDMGPRPSKGHSVERRDNNGGYNPANCFWATRTEQNRNKKDNALLTVDGETLPVSAWAERCGLKYGTLHQRLRQGWTPEQAVKTPKVTARKGVKRGLSFRTAGAERGVVWSDPTLVDERRAAA